MNSKNSPQIIIRFIVVLKKDPTCRQLREIVKSMSMADIMPSNDDNEGFLPSVSNNYFLRFMKRRINKINKTKNVLFHAPTRNKPLLHNNKVKRSQSKHKTKLLLL